MTYVLLINKSKGLQMQSMDRKLSNEVNNWILGSKEIIKNVEAFCYIY